MFLAHSLQLSIIRSIYEIDPVLMCKMPKLLMGNYDTKKYHNLDSGSFKYELWPKWNIGLEFVFDLNY